MKYWERSTNNIVAESLDLAFFTVAKCANTSVKRIFLDHLGKHSLRDRDRPYKGLIFKDTKDIAVSGYVSFAICRDPWDRLHSCWKDKVRNRVNSHLRRVYGMKKGMSFDQFVRTVCRVPDEKADMHFVSQTHSMFFEDDFLPTHVMRFENLYEDWKVFQDYIEKEHGIQIPDIEHFNRSEGPDFKIAYAAEPWLINLVGERYHRDAQVFNYNPPGTRLSEAKEEEKGQEMFREEEEVENE